MGDNKIIKALECCITDDIGDCHKCPFDYRDEYDDLKKLALDLINRQKAEIEKKQIAFEGYLETAIYWKNKCEKLIKELEITRTYIHNAGLEWDLLSYYNKVCGVDDHCDCFIQEERYVNQKSTIVDICNGTKERDECSCRGHKSRCTFYPKKEMDGDTND